jgi:ubiquitin C-terminal hydrolase
MSNFALNKRSEESNIYDLYAISNHMGSLYGGHYTAHCKNSLDGRWYEFNDSSVGRTNESHLVCSSAYVLFYRRRGLTSEQLDSNCGIDVEALD